MPDLFPDDGQIRFRKVRDVGSVLNASFEIIKRNAREMVVSYLAIVAPVAVAASIASVLMLSRMGSVFANPNPDPEEALAMLGFFASPAYAFSIVFSLVSYVVAQAAAGAYVRLYRQGEAGAITPGALWDETRGLVLPVLGLTLVAGLAFVLTGLINILPCLGTIAWVVLLVWAWPVVSVALVSRILESDSIAEAWTRARSLVKDSWAFAFGSLFLAWVVAVLLAAAVGGVGALMGGIAGVGFGMTPDVFVSGVTPAMVVIQVVSSILTYAFYLVPFVAAFFVHGRLVEEMDGTRLHDDLDALAGAGFDVPTSRATTPPTSTPPALPSAPPLVDDGNSSDDTPADEPGFRGGGFGSGA